MTTSEIQEGAVSADARRDRAAARSDGFLLILVLSFALSAVIILGWAWRSGVNRVFAAQADATIFPGFTAETASGTARGLIVTSLRSGSEAAADGLQVGDAIVGIDGRSVDTLDQARRYLRRDHRPALSLDLVHEKQLRHVRLTRSTGGDDGAQAAGGGG